jgi:hypothetical protein
MYRTTTPGCSTVQLTPVNLLVDILDRFDDANIKPFAVGAPAGEVPMALGFGSYTIRYAGRDSVEGRHWIGGHDGPLTLAAYLPCAPNLASAGIGIEQDVKIAFHDVG